VLYIALKRDLINIMNIKLKLFDFLLNRARNRQTSFQEIVERLSQIRDNSFKARENYESHILPIIKMEKKAKINSVNRAGLAKIQVQAIRGLNKIESYIEKKKFDNSSKDNSLFKVRTDSSDEEINEGSSHKPRDFVSNKYSNIAESIPYGNISYDNCNLYEEIDVIPMKRKCHFKPEFDLIPSKAVLLSRAKRIVNTKEYLENSVQLRQKPLKNQIVSKLSLSTDSADQLLKADCTFSSHAKLVTLPELILKAVRSNSTDKSKLYNRNNVEAKVRDPISDVNKHVKFDTSVDNISKDKTLHKKSKSLDKPFTTPLSPFLPLVIYPPSSNYPQSTQSRDTIINIPPLNSFQKIHKK